MCAKVALAHWLTLLIQLGGGGGDAMATSTDGSAAWDAERRPLRLVSASCSAEDVRSQSSCDDAATGADQGGGNGRATGPPSKSRHR